ncbi:uncharacterized protein N7515_002428 [Penicillium bovifimosum]|uniref:RING-type domain-containing protein n=1 Tax=Penicillium bovifimosum TaxID=126998 RepID=A0A9W9L9C9_9EURO|nr:uncharacterized protein N7515_002428 [Penicillium bovifimosum]KAJ5143641.1 hypothetical protein N7515_002428 [Penicillium bovifimosum]
MSSPSSSRDEASGLVNTLQSHVDDIRTLIQCGICIRPLYEPYTMACGHTFCYSCLSSWFAGGRSKRTCPDCRAPVKVQPTPAYLVRAVVQIFTGRAELLDKGETTTEHKKHQIEEAERLERDRTNNHPTEGGLFGGLFKPKPPPLQPVIDIDDGVARCPHCTWELEDGVNCAGCGYRYRPHSEGTDDSADYSDSDLDSLDGMEGTPVEDILEGSYREDGYGEDDYGEDGYDEDDYDEDDSHGYAGRYIDPGLDIYGERNIFSELGRLLGGSNNLNLSLVPGGFPPSGNTNGSEYDEEDEEENEYDESDSFIDAEDDHVPTSSFVHTEGHYIGSASESERDTGTVVDDDHSDVPPRPIGLDYRTNSGYFLDEASDNGGSDDEQEDEDVSGETSDGEEDEEASDEQEDTIQTAPPRRAFPQHSQRPPWLQAPSEATWLSARPSTLIPDSDDLVEPSEASASSPPIRTGRIIGRRPTQHGNNPRNAITLDDSDEDQPVGPMRRATQRRRARFSPY